MIHWIRDHRRRQLLETPFPSHWEKILNGDVAHFPHLGDGEKSHLRELIRIFIAEKKFSGAGGLEITDAIRVVIAGQACLIAMALPFDLYPNVGEIVVYPSTVVIPARVAGVFESPMLEPVRGPMPILGEAILGGTVILVWDEVKRNARHPERGHNVVYHEFAHQLDLLEGRADGTPPLANVESTSRWVAALEPVFLDLRARAARGESTFLDPYGATNEAEFFAVATEWFFDLPLELRAHHPDLYSALADFYRQDPAMRLSLG